MLWDSVLHAKHEISDNLAIVKKYGLIIILNESLIIISMEKRHEYP